jgi:hypothetical protein
MLTSAQRILWSTCDYDAVHMLGWYLSARESPIQRISIA